MRCILFFRGWARAQCWLAIALSSAAASPARAQNGRVIGKRGKYTGIPYEMRQRLEAQDQANAGKKDTRALVDVVGTPWVNANGEQLVGVVEDREMTKSQLARRVNLLLQLAPPIADPVQAEDQRLIFESRVLSDWKEMAVLAHHAEVKGTMVTEAEVDAALQKLLSQSDEDLYKKGVQKASMIGIPEAELRNEVRDGLLVEKYVKRRVQEVYTDETRHKLFDAGPQKFVEPSQVNAWHLFLPTLQHMTSDQESADEKIVKRYAKELRKASKPEDYDKLMQETSNDKDKDQAPLLLKPSKWYSEDEDLEEDLKKALFTTNPGKMSDVFRSDLGWHVVKIIERKDGDRVTFENAIPKIDNYLFDIEKDNIYQQILQVDPAQAYKINTDAGGLQHWRSAYKAPPAETTDAGQASGPAQVLVKDIPTSGGATGEPDLESLRKRLKPHNAEELKLLAPLPPPPPEK